jgi:hypothetical protein
MRDERTERGRALTPTERALLPTPLARGVDFDRVRIISRPHSPLAALLRVTVVRGARIYWADAPDEARTLPERAHLAHELVHVWQYEHLGRSGLAILADRRYRYRLEPGAAFADFGPEQQAAIVEDQVRLAGGLPPRFAIRPGAPAELYARVIDGVALLRRA